MPYIERKTYTKDHDVIRWEKYYCYLFRPEGIPLQELRAKKEKESPDDLKRRNARRRESNIAMRIANNFKEGDADLTMTYDAEHLPKGEERKERVEKDLRNLLGRIGRRYKKEGQEFRYVTTPENVAPGKKGRPHIHILLPALKVATTDRELERLFGKIWGKGRVHVRQYGGEITDAARLASYFGKEGKSEGGARIRFSRNCEMPKQQKKIIRRADCFSQDVRVPKGYRLVKELTYQGFTRDGYPCQTVMLEKLRGREEQENCRYTMDEAGAHEKERRRKTNEPLDRQRAAGKRPGTSLHAKRQGRDAVHARRRPKAGGDRQG